MSQPLSALDATAPECETPERARPSPKRFTKAPSIRDTSREENVEQTKTVPALCDLPLDIIMEILSHATPEALLVLSRATKFLRSTLMSRSAISVWRGSLNTVDDLPPKPDNMTEPQYVDLIWGTGCSFCRNTEIVISSFATRRRYCEKCLEKECITERNIPCHLEEWVGLRTLCDMIPSVRFRAEYGYNERHFDRAITNQYETKVITMLGRNESSHLVELPKWVSDKELAYAAVDEHAWLLESWYERYDIERKDDARQQSIAQRLIDMGWGYELSRLPAKSLRQHQSMQTSVPLTDDEWEHIKEGLVQFMVGSRERRLVRDKEMAHIQRRKLLLQVYPRFLCRKPFNALMPPVDDICLTDEFRRVSESVPDVQDLSAYSLMKTLETIPEPFFDQLRAKAEDELVALVKDRLQKDHSFKTFLGLGTITRDTLKLATIQLTNLVGNTFGHGYSYPTIFHWFEFAFFHSERLQRRWDDRCLYIGSEYPSGASIVKRMVELALRDPASTTAYEMDDLDPWYYFAGEDQNGERKVYAWRCVLSAVQKPREPRLESLAILNAEDTARARGLFASLPYENEFRGRDSLCRHCGSRHSESTDLRAHMQKKHGIERMTRKDFRLGLSVNDAPHMTVSIPSLSG